MILLHGFTGGPRSFGDVPARIPDLPGHGTAPLATSWHDAVSQIVDMLGPAPEVLGGYSMGARLALAVALRAPHLVSRLVLESGSPGIEDGADRAARRLEDGDLASLLEREGIEAFLRKWEASPILAGQPHDQLRAERLRSSARGLASALRQLGQGAQPSLWKDLASLRMPALLVVGERDAKYLGIARRMQALVPHAELVVVPRAGHAPHLEGFSWRTLT